MWLISTTAPLYLRATVHWQSRRLGVVQCLAGTNKQDKAANSEKERRAQSPLSGRSGGLLVSLLVVPFHRQTGRILASWFAAFTKRSEAHRERERQHICLYKHRETWSESKCAVPLLSPSTGAVLHPFGALFTSVRAPIHGAHCIIITASFASLPTLDSLFPQFTKARQSKDCIRIPDFGGARQWAMSMTLNHSTKVKSHSPTTQTIT